MKNKINFLEEKILSDGNIKQGNILKIDNFLNHQIDIDIMRQIAYELKRRFRGVTINKVLTIEASGIAIATMLGDVYDVPVVFAKKSETANSTDDKYVSQAYSFTLLVCLGFQVFAKGFFRSLSVLFGLIAGYILAVCMGMVNFSGLSDVGIVSLSLSVGLGFTQASEMFTIFPQIIRTIFAENCVAVVSLLAVVLNLILPNKPENQTPEVVKD